MSSKGIPNNMTAWGIGPKLACITFPYFVLTVILHATNPDLFVIARSPHIVFPIVGVILIVVGLILWALGARKIDRAFEEGRLLTKGVYALVRNPMYSGLIVFAFPGIAFCLRSWLVLTAPVLAYVVFLVLIKKEEKYLEEKFGQAFLDYESKVPSIIPFTRFPKKNQE